jgi:hypothetical protein
MRRTNERHNQHSPKLFITQGENTMLVAKEHREKLSRYCLLRKVTQEVVVNEWIGEALQRLDADPVMGEKLKRAEELQRKQVMGSRADYRLECALSPSRTHDVGSLSASPQLQQQS